MGRKAFSSRDFQFASSSANGRPSGLNFRRSRGLILLRPAQERLNKEVKRRADVVGIFPGEASIVRLIGAVLLEQNDEWPLQQRSTQVEAMAEILPPD